MQTSGLFYIVMLVLMIVFLFVLPAQRAKKMREQITAMQNSLAPGTQVVTVAGMFGVISEIHHDADFVLVEIAPGAVVKMKLAAVAEVVAQPVESSVESLSAENHRVSRGGSDTPPYN